ncbi:MAG: fibrobacter succinogenes major paralogous domain-containing protein, partial [Chitinispirillaceae bacterium]|nr:fibrobacter succinogenes major paralogous domain-containing protein [Chitinispirillaceae bacterium]
DSSSGAYCFYSNTTNLTTQQRWGALYNWYAVNSQKLAPPGWRVATDSDWVALENYLIANGYNYDGSTNGNKIAKSLATTSADWTIVSNPGAIGNGLSTNNRSGFGAQGGGYRSNTGSFTGQNTYGYWWTNSESDGTNAYIRILSNSSSGLDKNSIQKRYGCSVRLVRDLE